MKLLQLTATFGCLDNETLTFRPGLTLITLPNGKGKSTWCAFLRTMLYGLDTRQRDRKGLPADKNRYRPWNGKPMEGLLLCEHQGEILEIRRTSASGIPMGDFSAVYQATDQPVPGLTGENLGQTLTGVSREVFDRSVFLRQTNLAVSHDQELEKRIAALVSSGQEEISFSESEATLRAWQRKRRFHKSGLIPQMEAELADLQATQRETFDLRQELDRLTQEARQLEEEAAQWETDRSQSAQARIQETQQRQAEAQTALDTAQGRIQALEGELDNLTDDPEEWQEEAEDIRGTVRSRKRLMTGFTLMAILLTLAAVALYAIPRYIEPLIPDFPLSIPPIPFLFLASIVAVLWGLVVFFLILKGLSDLRANRSIRKLQVKIDDFYRQDSLRQRALDDAYRQRDHARQLLDALSLQGGPLLSPQAQACEEDLQALRREMARIQGQLSALGDPLWVDARMDQLQEEILAVMTDHSALDVALEALQEADSQLQSRLSPQLSQRAGEYFSRLTEGRYTQVSLTRDLEVTVREGDSLAERPLSYLSQGTADQLYLALRLALADLLLPQPEACPLILDDAFLTFDDRRLALALEVMAELAQTRQVLLFTCQSREGRMLQEMEASHV
ncbi:MAG: AAA family ATPase [Ruminiclostridium sp.]|nr:AAA family ATPase [Ruminiclostridium sp.]